LDSTKYRQCKIIKEYVFKDAFLDTKFDSEIVRGYFLCRLINVLQAAKQDFLAPFNDQSLYAWLDHVEIDFFKPIDFIEGEDLDFIERLCRSPELLQENFQEILSYMSPYIVADWDEFLTPDNLGEVKHRDSAALLILYFVLKKAESLPDDTELRGGHCQCLFAEANRKADVGTIHHKSCHIFFGTAFTCGIADSSKAGIIVCPAICVVSNFVGHHSIF